MDPIALDPLITGEVMGNTVAIWMYLIVGVGTCAALVGVFTFILSENQSISAFAFVLALLFACVAAFGISRIVLNQPRDERVVDHEVLAELITERYELDAVSPADPLGEYPSNRETSAQVTALCAPLSTESLEMKGITGGQQITFKVAVADCKAEKPVAEIVVTDTPGQPISAEDLER